ncbi:MAG: helix-turn-helix domain-containing protein [Spirochaetaceae bacterium]|jgi:transcriptional regulator with XRE-family HTH domain|nr:helix-turn-helix domain-containing protein [Spirochaetaceae bacterium]
MAKHFKGEDIRKIFGANLKLFRTRKGLSQLALSAKSGLAHNFVNDIENRKKWVSPETIAKLAAVLDVEPYQLLMANPLDGKQTKRIHVYLDELKDSFNEVVGEIKASYLMQGKDDR